MYPCSNYRNPEKPKKAGSQEEVDLSPAQEAEACDLTKMQRTVWALEELEEVDFQEKPWAGML